MLIFCLPVMKFNAEFKCCARLAHKLFFTNADVVVKQAYGWNSGFAHTNGTNLFAFNERNVVIIYW